MTTTCAKRGGKRWALYTRSCNAASFNNKKQDNDLRSPTITNNDKKQTNDRWLFDTAAPTTKGDNDNDARPPQHSTGEAPGTATSSVFTRMATTTPTCNA